ncbi:aminotransferase class V-fold PLP-dependent enzyme [Agromyces flavus]|uniref:aminotransferase class V-fold PLP-dependent enzyme n=1 Tax=Agromyces flavus TaxID=589382 RepID=UPI0036079C1D
MLPYKFLGPHCGVLVARPELLETITPDKLLPATNAVPERFEFGTLPYELLAGVTAAVEVLASLDTGAPDAASSRRERLVASYAALHEHEASLAARLGEGLAALPRVTVWSRAERRTPTVLMTFDGIAAEDVTRRLAEDRVLAPSGNFYALEASRRLGLGDEGGLRVGLAPYTDQGDVERLLGGLRAALA